jgi:hypothetical protein
MLTSLAAITTKIVNLLNTYQLNATTTLHQVVLSTECAKHNQSLLEFRSIIPMTFTNSLNYVFKTQIVHKES